MRRIASSFVLTLLSLLPLAGCWLAEKAPEVPPAPGAALPPPAPGAALPPPAPAPTAEAVPGWRDAAKEGIQPSTAQADRIEVLVPILASGDNDARKSARDELIEMGAYAVPNLVSHLEDPDMTIRWEMVNILGYIRDPRSIGPLIERTISDDNPHPRWRAIWALGAADDGTARDKLWTRLQSGTLGEKQRWNAVVALSNFRDERVLPAILEGLQAPTGWQRWEAVNALGRLRSEGSVAALRPFLQDQDQSVRRETVMVLGKIDGSEAVALLLPVLENPDFEMRWRAAMALKGLSDPRIAPAAEARLRVEKDEQTKKYLQEIVRTSPAAPPGR